jgi:hypothetical protein
MALSQVQVRKLVDQLATTLNSITSDDVKGQALRPRVISVTSRRS